MMHVRCPHCHNSTKVSEADPDSEILCSSCGSSFNLVQDDTVAFEKNDCRTIAHFELIEQLGMGAFGTVWKGKDTQLDRIVAIKIPRKGELAPEELEQFSREAQAAAQLKHPNIVGVHEVGQDGDTAFIVTDFISGMTLADQLTAERPPVTAAVKLCHKIAEALDVAHSHGIVHRDVKPANILLDEKNEPHIADFGLAKRDAGDVTMTINGQILGTPAYMSPEQAKGDAHQADARSDIYSLGVVLFELLTGEKPFRGNTRMLLHQVLNDDPPSPRKLNSNIPRDLETICLKCLEKEPDRRFSSARLFAEELQRFLEGKPILSRPTGSIEIAFRWCRRRPTVTALLASIVLITLIAFVTVSWQWNHAVAARKQTERQLEISLNSFRSMVGMARDEFSDVKTLRPDPYRLSEQLLLKSIAGLEKIDLDVSERTPVDRDLVVGRTTLGMLYQDAGKLPNALKQFELAHQLVRETYDDESVNPQAHRDFSISLERLVDIHLDLGHPLRANQLALQCVEVRQKICRLDETDSKARFELAVATGRAADTFLELGEVDRGRNEYANLIAELESLLENTSSPSSSWLRLRAQARERIGDSFLTEKNPTAALKQYRLALDEFQGLSQVDPDNVSLTRDLSMVCVKIGDTLLGMDQLEQALSYQQEALTLREKNATAVPTNVNFQRDVAVSLDNLGDIEMSRNNLNAAHTHYGRAIKRFEELNSLGLGNSQSHQTDLAILHRKVGHLCRRLENHPEALGHYQRSLELRLPQFQQSMRVESQKNLARLRQMRLHLWIAGTAIECRDLDVAGQHIQNAQDQADFLDVKMLRFWDVRLDGIELTELKGRLREKQGQTAAATGLYEKALAELKELGNSPNPKGRLRFDQTLNRLAESVKRLTTESGNGKLD